MVESHKIELVPYDPSWPFVFQTEAVLIKQVLGNELTDIYHIGSTSIPDMPAKPVIDILVVIDDAYRISLITEQLIQLGYAPLRRQFIPHVSFITSKVDGIGFHVHIHERGSPQINRHVNFRDYVIAHPDIARSYADLKVKLAHQFSNDLFSYVSGKSKLVQEIDKKAKLWISRKTDYPTSNTGPVTTAWPNEYIQKAMEANFNLHMTYFAQYLNQVELIRVPGFTLVHSGLADDTLNYIMDADFTSVGAKEKIAEVTDYFYERQIPFSWWISPHDQPEDLSFQLENDGYKNTENNCAMYFDLDALDDDVFSIPDLNIVRANDEKTLRDFAVMLTNNKIAFETYFSWIASILTDEDPIEYYVGYVSGKPVVRGLSCYFAQIAGLYCLSTAPSERRKDYADAMQIYRLKRAKELGYHIAVLQASHEDYPLYQQLGYQECGYFREYKK
ncbi:MAG TPA: GrpB family protein [Legionellaceae bacterium]|nr:GrpB family protein [Legionellaceae bacterium]